MNNSHRGVATIIAIGLVLSGCAVASLTPRTTPPPSVNDSAPPIPTGKGTLTSPTGDVLGTVSLTPDPQSSSYRVEVTGGGFGTGIEQLFPFLTTESIDLSEQCWDHNGLALTPLDPSALKTMDVPDTYGDGTRVADSTAFTLATGSAPERAGCYPVVATARLTWK